MAKKALTVKTAIMAALVFAVVVVLAQFSGLMSAISPPMETTLKDGSVWWTTTLNVDSIGEGLEFWVNPLDMDSMTLEDGTEVIPTSAFNMYFSKNRNTCSYSLTKDSRFSFFGITLWDYYKLSNPTRSLMIDVNDGKNNVLKTIDATDPETLVFKDLYDGKGTVEVKPQGILSGAKDCPESSNVVVVFKDGEALYYDRIDFNEKREDISITSVMLSGKMLEILWDWFATVDTADIFTSEFESYTLDANEYTKSVSGDIDKLGSGVIVVSVSEDFVDAMRYSPAKHIDPKITAINTASKIETDTTGILRVVIENKASHMGMAVVTPTAGQISFTPTSREITLDGYGTAYADFTFQAGKIFTDTDTIINVHVASMGSQFGGSNTDDDYKTITITKEQSVDEPYCGDGTCQDELGETYSSCPADCTGLNPCVDIDNSEPNWLGKCVCIEGYNPVIEGGQLSCKADKDYTPYFILGGLAFAGFLFMLLVVIIAIQINKK